MIGASSQTVLKHILFNMPCNRVIKNKSEVLSYRLRGERGKDMKKHKNLTARECYFRYHLVTIVGVFIMLIGELLDIFWIQTIGIVIFSSLLYYLTLFFKRREEEENEK